MNPITDEPVVTSSLATLASAGALLMAFGVHLTGVQIAAVGQFAQDVVILAFLVRSQVTPKAHAAPKA